MTEMKRIFLAVLVLGLLFGSLVASRDFVVQARPVIPSRAEVIAEIQYAQWTHQYWADYMKAHPDFPETFGSIAWQERWVETYKWTIWYLRSGDEFPPKDWRIEQGLIKEDK